MVVAYIKCLGDIKKKLQSKGIDSTLLIIIEMKRSFTFLSAPISSQVIVPQHSPAQSFQTTTLVKEGDGFVEDLS